MKSLIAVILWIPAFCFAQNTIDGRWRTVTEQKSAGSGEVVTFSTKGDTVSMSTSTGVSYIAKTDGTDAPIVGDKNVRSVSVTLPSPGVLVEVSKKDKLPWLSMRMEVNADGKTANVTWKNLNTSKQGSYSMARD